MSKQLKSENDSKIRSGFKETAGNIVHQAVWMPTGCIDICKRQIERLGQHFEALSLLLEAIRSTLKDLTEQVNRQWVVKTPITPVPSKHSVSIEEVEHEEAKKGEKRGRVE